MNNVIYIKDRFQRLSDIHAANASQLGGKARVATDDKLLSVAKSYLILAAVEADNSTRYRKLAKQFS